MPCTSTTCNNPRPYCTTAFCGYYASPRNDTKNNNYNSYSSTASSPSQTDSSGMAGAGFVGVGLIAAGLAIAAAGVVYATYKVSEFGLNWKYPNKNNKISAGIITASIYSALAAGYYTHIKNEERLANKYPAISISIDSKNNLHVGKGTDATKASIASSQKCQSGLFESCRAVATAPAGSSICISIAQSISNPSHVYRDIFSGKIDRLNGTKLLCAMGLEAGQFSRNDPTCDISKIEYVCNSPEMNKTIEYFLKSNRELDQIISGVSTSVAKDTIEANTSNTNASIKTYGNGPSISEISQPSSDPMIKPDENAITPQTAIVSEPFKIASGNYYIITAQQLNLRQGPGTKFNIIGTFMQGSCVKDIGTKENVDGFMQVLIETEDKNLLKGFVSEKYVYSAPSGTDHTNCLALPAP